AINGLLDIGVNYFGWDIQEMGKYLGQYYGELDDADLNSFYDTITNDPCVFLPYCVGYYQVKDLVDELRDKYDNDKDAFSVFLDHSNLSLKLIHYYLDPDGSV
ncbi:MAG: hypothetical protein IKN57_08835, partial [Parasporobacterium sp.]|nr:hypothetical protein [Parasporobacterium sp.]